MNTIEAKLNLHRKTIRRCQLDNIFAQKRTLMLHTIDDDIEGILFKCLEKVKRIYIERVEDYEEVKYFKLLHAIINQYASIQYFCQLVCPIPGQSKSQLALSNSTWLDLLLEFIKLRWQIPEYNEQISAVISGLAYQLHSQIKIRNDGNIYYQQMCRVVYNYPFELLRQDSVVLVNNTLITIFYISTYDNKKSWFNYHLLNKTQPPLLKTLNLIFNNQELLMVAELRHSYMMAGLSIISMMNRFHLQNLQSDKYKTLCSNVLRMASQQLDQSKSKEEFQRACSQLELISRVKEYSPTQQEFRKFQRYLDRQIRQKNTNYFKLLKQILQKNAYKLTLASLEKLAFYIFSKIYQITDEQLNLRVVMLVIIKQHCINNGNMLNLQESESFIQSWGECACRLVDFADSIKYSSFSKYLPVLFEVLKHVLNGWPKAEQLITEGHLSCLLRYKDYRIILQQIGYELYGEEQVEDEEYDHYQEFGF